MFESGKFVIRETHYLAMVISHYIGVVKVKVILPVKSIQSGYQHETGHQIPGIHNHKF